MSAIKLKNTYPSGVKGKQSAEATMPETNSNTNKSNKKRIKSAEQLDIKIVKELGGEEVGSR